MTSKKPRAWAWILAAFAAQAAASPGIAMHKGSPNLEPGLRGRSDIVFFCDFESDNWYREWGYRRVPARTTTLAADEACKFAPFQDKALRIKVNQGGHYGASLQFRFKKELGAEPEEIYFRYYLRFAADWDPAKGGKMPGFGGTYGRAGWGGKPVNGRNGWSARGSFSGQKGGKTAIGYYCYHADMRGKYGSVWRWKQNRLGYLENNRWYCVEGYVKLNTPAAAGGKGANDGILRGWVDGKLAFEKTDVRFRDVETLKIETVWVNIYLGGTWVAQSDHHLYVDNVVIARSPIGPMRRKLARKKPQARRFVFKPKAAAKPPALAAYAEQLRLIEAREKAGDFAGAAAEVRRLAESATSEDAIATLAFMARALDDAASLRTRIIETVQAGKRVNVYVDLGVGRTRARTIGADEETLQVQAQGATVPVPWRSLSRRDFIGVASRVLAGGTAADLLAIARYCIHAGLPEKGREALDQALGLDRAVKDQVKSITARLQRGSRE